MAQGRGQPNVTNIYIVNNDPNFRFDAASYADFMTMGSTVFRGQNVTVTPQGVVVDDLRMREEMRRRRVEEEARKKREEMEKKKKWEAAAKKFPCMSDKNQRDWSFMYHKYKFREEENFYELRIHKAVETLFTKNFTVFLLGYTGDGKTATAKYFAHVKAKKFNSFKAHEVLYISTYEEWQQKVKGDKQQIVVIEDIFGANCMNAEKVEMWQDVLFDMRMQAKIADGNLVLIVTCGKHIYSQVKSFLKGCDLFPPCETVDLSEENRCKDEGERAELLKKVISSTISYEMKKELNKSSHLPIASRLYMTQKRSRVSISTRTMFQDPFYMFQDDVDHLYQLDKSLFSLLVYVAMKNRAKMKFNSLDEMPEQDKELLKSIFRGEELDINDLEPWIIAIFMDMLSGTFVLDDGDGFYRMINPGLRARILNVFSYKRTEILVEQVDRDTLLEFITVPGAFLGYNHQMVTASYSRLDKVARRVVFEILQGHMKFICSHHCFREEKFTALFFEYMEKLGNAEAVLCTRDELDKSLMYWSAWYGRDPLLAQLVDSDQWWEMAHEEERNLAFVFALYRGGCQKSLKLFFEKRNYSAEELPPLELDGVQDLHGYLFHYELSASTTPLHLAAYSDCMHTLREILPRCTNLDQPNHHGQTAVHIAAERGSTNVLGQLLQKDVDVTSKTPRGITPLQLAVCSGNSLAMRSLLEKDAASLKEPTDDGHPLLHTAVSMKNMDVVRMLVERGADKNERYIKTWKPLMHAVHLGDLEVARYLIDKDCDKFVGFYPQDTPLHWALEDGDDDMSNFLMEQAMYTKDMGTNSWYPLHTAAKMGNEDVIKTLLKIGANPRAKNSAGETPKEVAKKYDKSRAESLLWNDKLQPKRDPYSYGYSMPGFHPFHL